ncbi:MAG: branched-chain amino acid aminotransferase [Clostridia bacterium]|nr:branched-chain amino acid aminotransferase [Clostridia bacterium]
MEINLTINRTTAPKQKPADENSLGFGRYFSDHMLMMDYKNGAWSQPRIEPYHRLSLDPASSVLHYAQEIFEGLKAYRRADGSIVMFRPWENAKRLNRSADRMCMPPVDVDLNVEAMRRLVELESDWVPKSFGTSLYLRPTMIANDEALGVHAAKDYIYYVICAPSGSYYATGLAPVKIKIEDQYARAVKGGMGFAKTGGNYACSIKAGDDAVKAGYSQVLWLDGEEKRYVQEVGAMNMMFVIDGKLVTAPLDGSILPGVTRDSVLTIARDEGMIVEERKLSVDELMDAIKDGRLTEAFGTGTAAVISPVGVLCYHGVDHVIGDGNIGKVSQHFYDTITGIQWGTVEDKYGWILKVKD